MVQVGPDLVFGRVLGEVHVDLGDHYVLDFDDGDLVDVAAGQGGQGCEAYVSEHMSEQVYPARR